MIGIFGAIGYGGTETKFFAWMIPPIVFTLYYFTYLLNVGEYAKVLLHRDTLLNPWKAFWKASGYVNKNFKTMQIYWSVIFVSVVLVLLYLWIESNIGMTSGFTIWLMFLIQQTFVFGRVFIKIWNLSNAFDYISLKPIPLTIKPQIIEPIEQESNNGEDEQENKLSE